jgi:hypothetical protein
VLEQLLSYFSLPVFYELHAFVLWLCDLVRSELVVEIVSFKLAEGVVYLFFQLGEFVIVVNAEQRVFHVSFFVGVDVSLALQQVTSSEFAENLLHLAGWF